MHRLSKVKYFHTEDDLRTVWVGGDAECGYKVWMEGFQTKKKLIGTYTRKPYLHRVGDNEPPAILFDINIEEAKDLLFKFMPKMCPAGMEDQILPYPEVMVNEIMIKNAIKDCRIIPLFGLVKLELPGFRLGGECTWNSMVHSIMEYLNHYEELKALS